MRLALSLVLAAAWLAPANVAIAQDDPHEQVYLVSSRATWDTSLKSIAREPDERRDGLGKPVVVSQVSAHRLEDLSQLVHERERRCGGFFSFPTRAAAEAFLLADRSAEMAQATAAVDYTIDQQQLVGEWLPEVEESRLRATIQHMSTHYPNRYFLSNHGEASARWLRDYWLELANGRPDVSAQLNTCTGCGYQPSVILTIQGAELPDEVVVVGGHLDSISSTGSGDFMDAPGADDNASGMAVITEAIRISMASGWRPKRTVKFMGYAAEEVGLRGSKAIADAYQAQGIEVVGVLQLDMTNFNDGSTALDLRLISDYSSAPLQQFVRDLFDEYLAPYGLTRGSSACGYACSDHASWTAAGYPAAFVAEPVLFPTRHTPTDKMPNVGADAQVSVPFARLALAFVAELGKAAAPANVGDALRAIHDLNGDDRSDLLWRHAENGANTLWLSARSGTRQPMPRVVDPAWSVAGIGDFDGDGEDDLFWRHAVTGANTVWRSGRSARRMPIRDVTDTTWEVVGIGDFDGDSLDDVVWRQRGTGANSIWRAANADAPLAMEDDANLNWEVAGIGDFDADGLSDVYWKHRTNGALRYWPAADAARAVATRGPDPDREVPETFVGDFDGNGASDLLVRRGVQLNVYPAGTVAGDYNLAPVLDADTRIEGTGDYDGDGRADVFFHNARTGANTIWLGGRSSERQAMPAVRDAAWIVQP